jgi:hypothetical protein
MSTPTVISIPSRTTGRALSIGFPAVDSNFPNCRYWRQVAGLLLLFVAPVAFSAPGFIAGSKVTRGNVLAEISVQFACGVEYIDHFPTQRGETVRIQLASTAICSGVSPLVARSREQLRPLQADLVGLQEIIYDGNTVGNQTLTLVFDEAVGFDVVHTGTSNIMVIRLHFDEPAIAVQPQSGATGVRVQKTPDPKPAYVVNLSSSRKAHAESDMPTLELEPGLELFESEVVLAGVTWYRLRLGYFMSSAEAQAELANLHDRFPTAWVDHAPRSVTADSASLPTDDRPDLSTYATNTALASIGLDRIDELMADARTAMVATEYSRAVQIYTKVLRAPNHDRHPQAQEFLALAREKNGQMAHARAEYQRYLALYPDSEGASRVSQRLATLLAVDRKSTVSAGPVVAQSGKQRTSASDWRVQTFFSQYYRRDVNQMNDAEEVVSQSALYSDINLDARRRGERFDFSSRLSAGYRNDFLGEGVGSGNQLRISYAYADLADAATGLRGRIGRQSRNTGGVLGRFDGLNFGYQASDRILVNAVVGRPVNSAVDGVDSERSFYGTSINYGPILENLELGMFYIEQDIEGVQDRQAVGTEFRYFGPNQSFWGLIDYDTSFKEVGSAYLQGSWRFESRLTLHGSLDRRRSPFLSTGNALIGQPVATFAELLVLMTEEEIRQLSLDRTSIATTYTIGLSHSLTPRLQINADANQTKVDATPASGGVAATPQSTYRYYSTNLTASSLLMEGDVSIVGLRYSTSDTTNVMSLTLDTRLPIGRTWRINPRIRVDRRQMLSDSSYEWIYTPGLRMQFRKSQKFRLELEIGKRFSQRDSAVVNLDRESYFINLGYQAFF